MPIQYNDFFRCIKVKNFGWKTVILFPFLHKTLTAGTRQNHRNKAVLTGTRNSRPKENNIYHCKSQSCYLKVGFEGIEII